jgi:hypothetical protein
MSRYQITADIDVTLWLGALLHYKHVPNKIEYINLEELFESENVYFPTRDELKNQLRTVTKNLEYEFLAYLRELTDKRLFKIDNAVVCLPLSDEAFIARFGRVSTFVNGTFDTVVETSASQEDVFDVVERALNMAMDSENLRVENLDALGMACLDVREIGD